MEFITLLFSEIAFICAVVFAFYIPGRVILGKSKFSGISLPAVAIVLGIVAWAFQGLLVGYLHLRWLSYLYILFFVVWFIKEKYYELSFQFRIKNWDFITIIIAGVGILGQILPYLRFGWTTSQGIIIAAHNPEDHIWHASLVRELITRFPPNEPAIAGVKLQDYHYLYNLVTADLIRVFHLPFFSTQFDGMYILAPVLLGVLAYSLSKAIYPSKLFTRLFLFFIFFSGDAAGWVMLILRHTFNWNLASLINDASKFMDSPPYGYAIVIGITGLYCLLLYKDKMSKRMVVLIALCFGCLLEFKVYVGIPFLVALGGYAAGSLFKRHIMPFVTFVLAGSIAFVLLKLGSSSSAGLIFLPVDIPRDFINQPALQLRDWQLRWIIFQDHKNTLRLIQYGAMMSGLYLLIQFGFQLLGLIPLPKIFKKIGLENSLFLFVGVLSSFSLGLFFYQTVGGANIWEFFLAASPLLSLLTALSITLIISKFTPALQVLVVLLVYIIVIPQWILSMQTYIREEYFSGFHGISVSQKAAYDFISTHTSKNSLIFLANQSGYSYASISNLFMNRDIYLSGNGVRQIVTPEIAKRRQEEIVLSQSENSQEILHVLDSSKASYIYYLGSPKNKISLEKANLHIVFSNQAATIFQTD